MNFSALYSALLAFFICLILVPLSIPLARKIGLTESPNERKHHNGQVPLLGGIVIWLAIVITILICDLEIKHAWAFYSAGTLAVLLGSIDDRYPLSVKFRFFVQIGISLIMAIGADNSLHNLGAIFGPIPLSLSGFGYVFTVICVVGVMNAINMMDGIDGLAGSVTIVALIGVSQLNFSSEFTKDTPLIPVIIACICAFLIFNLSFIFSKKHKIFLGNAGSMLLGLMVVWLLIDSSQGEIVQFRPITATWLLALPLIDMAAIMFRRIRKGQSPFKPDRDHLHHICMRADLSDRRSLFLITILAIVFAGIGVMGEIYLIPEYLMFMTFVMFYMIYSYCLRRIWRILSFFQRQRLKLSVD
jgi:UDP-GlcNAc:undecaprenyl-phosphate GlcNAc-1-phosphate transferase